MKLEDCHFILIYGGSFDPPHRAHVVLPEIVRHRLGADLVAYLPAARSPHKLDQQPTDARHRLAMLKLALRDHPRAVVLSDEIDRTVPGEPSYMTDTLVTLRQRLGAGVTLRLLVGADQARAFDRWKDAGHVIELADPVVMLRPPETPESLLASLPDASWRSFWACRMVLTPQMDISATEIRRRVREREPIDDLVPEPVARYIYEHGLYRQS